MEEAKSKVALFWYKHHSIKSSLKCLTCPILWPCFLCRSCMDRGCVPRSHRKQRKRESKINVLSQRLREMKIKNRKRSPSVDFSRIKRTKQQEQSPLLSGLPAEIRLRIFEMALCPSGRLHIQRSGRERNKYDLMALCSVPNMEPEKWTAYYDIENIIYVDPDKRAAKIALLLTCRRVYREAIEFLYSGNTFSFRSQIDFVLFVKSIPSQRLAQIRQISVEQPSSIDHHGDCQFKKICEGCTYHPDYVPYWWKNPLNERLSSMPNLRRVHVMFYGANEDRLREKVEFVEKIARTMRNCQFVVFIACLQDLQFGTLICGRYSTGELIRIEPADLAPH